MRELDVSQLMALWNREKHPENERERVITMNKTELILRIAEETGFSRKNVELGLNAAINLITKALTEE